MVHFHCTQAAAGAHDRGRTRPVCSLPPRNHQPRNRAQGAVCIHHVVQRTPHGTPSLQMLAQLTGQPNVPPNTVIVVQGITKVFVGELIETGMSHTVNMGRLRCQDAPHTHPLCTQLAGLRPSGATRGLCCQCTSTRPTGCWMSRGAPFALAPSGGAFEDPRASSTGATTLLIHDYVD